MSLGVYTDDEIEAIRAAIAHVVPVGDIEDSEHLLFNVELRAGGIRYFVDAMDTKPKPSEEAADLEAEASKLLLAAKVIENDNLPMFILRKHDEDERGRTVRHLRGYAKDLMDFAHKIRNHPYRKGKSNRAFPFLQQLLGLWVAAGQEISRYNKTPEFLEAAAKPIFPDDIKENTVDSFIRAALKEPEKYTGMKPQDFSGAENLH
jgi:hypothetical protein